MNSFARVDVETFKRFMLDHEGQRYELERGVIVQQMPGATRRHQELVRKVGREIENQIDAQVWTLLFDFGVEGSDWLRYPDVVVCPADQPLGSSETKRPVLIVEVLSPSTAATDLNTKLAEYLGLHSLQAYVVASQDEMAIKVWQRDAAGDFDEAGVEYRGPSAVAYICGLAIDVRLRLDEIYRGLL